MILNERSSALAAEIIGRAEALRVGVREHGDGAVVVDCGIDAPGGLAAGVALARICLADLGTVSMVPGVVGDHAVPRVRVFTDHPVAACLASQYAGWAVRSNEFFAMGSGPMRAAWGGEELFDDIGLRETAAGRVVGVLETRTMPEAEVIALIAEKCGVNPGKVTLFVAPTASLAGGVQVVARSVETALHKLHELEFDLERIVSGWGTAPVPPVARTDLDAIGRTNDAVLYGARVVLFVTGDDASLEAIGAKAPSSASSDYGATFLEIFERAGRDFYKIDPSLFSPAEITFQNIESGRSHRFGGLRPDVLAGSLFS